MPVWKFRDLESMDSALLEGPSTLESRLRAVWSLASVLVPPLGPRGVQKFHSAEDADAARVGRERQRSADLQTGTPRKSEE